MSEDKGPASAPTESWLVANDDEYGRKWFGRTVQTLRQDQGISVAELASAVELAEGTIRAIERGGRAPSEASGLRILEALLPSGEWSKNYFGPSLHALKDPNTGEFAGIEFGAKIRGDNGRWSRDRRPAKKDDDRKEFILRRANELAAENPEAWQGLEKGLLNFGLAIETIADHLQEPIDDANLGKVARRLPAINNLQADHLDKLLWLWGRINTGTASVEVIKKIEEIESILAEFLSEEELDELSSVED